MISHQFIEGKSKTGFSQQTKKITLNDIKPLTPAAFSLLLINIKPFTFNLPNLSSSLCCYVITQTLMQ